MALNPSTNATMAGRITASDANYPYASSQDETVPAAGDGTPYFKARADDLFGLQQALLIAAGIVPNGNAETVLISQYMQAIVEIAAGRAFNYDDSGAANAYVLDLQTNQHGVQSYFDGMLAEFTVGNTNTVASTVNVNAIGVRNIVDTATAGTLLAGDHIRLQYRLSSNDFVIIPTAVITEIYKGVAGGTVDNLTSVLIPPLPGLFNGTIVSLTALGANTTTLPSFNPNGLGARTIVKNGNLVLNPGDIFGSDHEILLKFNSGNNNWELLNPANVLASATLSGIVELATQTEVNTGTDGQRVVTPATLNGKTATQAEVDAGVNTTRIVTPATLNGKTASETRRGVAEIATQVETNAGTDDARFITPLKLNSKLATESLRGVVELAAAAEVRTGNDISRPSSVNNLRYHQGACKAWVNFNGTGVVTIRDDYNVTSITDNGTGNFTVNFTVAMLNANYAISGSASRSGFSQGLIVYPRDGGAYSTTAVQISTHDDGAVAVDPPICNVLVFGDQ